MERKPITIRLISSWSALLVACSTFLSSSGAQTSTNNTTSATCSPISNSNKGVIDIHCDSLNEEQVRVIKELPSLLNKALSHQLSKQEQRKLFDNLANEIAQVRRGVDKITATPFPSPQEIASAIAATNDGFIQITNEREVLTPITDRLLINFYFKSGGNRPIKDVQSWGMVLFQPHDKNPKQVHDMWARAVADGYAKFSGEGSDMGIGENAFNTAVGVYPFYPEMAQALRQGSMRMIFTASVAWKSEDGKVQSTDQCRWTDWKEYPDTSKLLWHAC